MRTIASPDVLIDPAGKRVPVASGSITAANLRVCTVAAGAFFWDASQDLSAYAGGGYLIEVYNAGGVVRAYTGAQGAGEAAGADIFAGFDLSNAGVWTPASATVNDANTFTVAAGGTGSVTCALLTAGRLYKINFNSDQTLGTTTMSGPGSTPAYAADPTVNGYVTAAGTSVSIRNATANAVVDILTMTFEPVTAAAATGFALRNARGLGGAQSVLVDTLTKGAAAKYRIYVI